MTLRTLALGVVLTSTAAAQGSDTIVKNATTPKYRSPTLVQEWRIGTLDGAEEYRFDDLRGVLRTKDGNLWIIDQSKPPTLRVYDSAGKFIRRVGGTGDGPGEFRMINGLDQLHDGRVVVRDEGHQRVNVYRADGRADTTWIMMSSYSYFQNVGNGILVDGSGALWLPFFVDAAGGSRTEYLRLRASGTIIDTVTGPSIPFPDVPGVHMTYANGRGAYTDGDRYKVSSVVALSPLGYFVTGVTATYAFEVRAPRGNASVWTPGDPVVSVRRTPLPVPISETERANIRAYLQFRIDRGLANGMRLDHGIPELRSTKPPYRYFLFDSDGRIWVYVTSPSEPNAAAEPTRPPRAGEPSEPAFKWREPMAFDVFEPDGSYVGRIAIPRQESDPLLMTRDAVWCASRDADGVNYLTKYRIIWK